MSKKEADFSIVFRHWLKANPMHSASFEIKDSRGKNYISFSEIKEEQIASGLANKSSIGNLIRVASGTVGAADYVYFRHAYAYFVIKYPGVFHVIDVETLEKEKQAGKQKSLLQTRAREISVISVSLNRSVLR